MVNYEFIRMFVLRSISYNNIGAYAQLIGVSMYL